MKPAILGAAVLLTTTLTGCVAVPVHEPYVYAPRPAVVVRPAYVPHPHYYYGPRPHYWRRWR